MNPQIFDLIEKGLTLLPTLIEAGVDITAKVQQMIKLNKAAKAGGAISDADLAAIRAEFDADLAAFNAPMA